MLKNSPIFIYSLLILFIFRCFDLYSDKMHCLENYPLCEIADSYGTPVYVYSEKRIRENYQRLFLAFSTRYPNCSVHYAVKANSNPAILQILRDEGAGFDCSCIEEVALVKQLGIPSDKIIYTGTYVPKSSVLKVLDSKIQMNFDCLSVLDHLSERDLPEVVSFRINPGIGMGGAEGLIFAGEEAKFGISESLVEEAYKRALNMGAKRFGAHMMTGSNVLDPTYFPLIVETLLDIIGPLSEKLGITFEYIDLGGSFGIPYHPDEPPLNIDEIAERVIEVLKRKKLEYKIGNPKIILEPGRYLIGDAGILLTQATSIKNEKKKFVGVDAGINTLYFLEGAYRHISLPEKSNEPRDTLTNVVGPLCTNKDVLATSILLPSSIAEGDLLCFHDVGAYGFCKTSQFNTRPRCAEVLISNQDSYLIREAETMEDLFKKTSIPLHLLLQKE